MIKPQPFRSRPQPVEAMQWTGDNLDAFRCWLGDDTVPPGINAADPDDDSLFIENKAGTLGEVSPGWWVVSTGSGVTVCKPDSFAACYEPVGGPAPEHLTPVTNDRGFDRLPPIETRHGDDTVDMVVSVAEASTATAPHVWLTVKGRPLRHVVHLDGTPDIEQGFEGFMSAHLTLEQARILEEQLAFLRVNHYHHQLGDHDE